MESAEAVFPERARESLRLAGYGYLFPMVIQGELRAILLVGRHRDASALEGRELDALAGLAAQAARSVEAARLYREIQERISREERLRRETQAILESSRIGILLVDVSGRVTSANRSAVEILGHPALLGKQVHDLLPRGLLMLLDRSGKEGRGEREGERVFRFSFGAAVGLRAACPDARVKAVIGVGLPVAAIDDRSYDFEFLRTCNKLKLFVSGTRDQFGPRVKLKQLVDSLADPKKLVLIEGAGHFFEGRLRELRETIENWVREFLVG